MKRLNAVRRICAGFPNVVEETAYGTPCFRPRSRSLFARWNEQEEALAMRTPPLLKEALLDAAPDVYFTTPHYDGYDMILVRLDRIDDDELAERLEDGWRLYAAKRDITAFEAAAAGTDDNH